MKVSKHSGGLSRRLMLSLGILGVAGAVAGLGTWAQFTDSTTASNSISTGTVDIELGADGLTNRFSENATLVAAGDTINRAVDLKLDGTLDLSAVSLAVTGGTTGLNNATDGLNLQVDECSVAWTEVAPAPGRTYSCSGTTTAAVANGDITAGGTLALSSLAPGDKHLLFTWTLPATADQDAGTNGKQSGETGAYTYTFTGTQRAATNR